MSHPKKVPLKFLMNPSGQMRDIYTLQESLNTETGLLSPVVSVEVVTALQAHKGKGKVLKLYTYCQSFYILSAPT